MNKKHLLLAWIRERRWARTSDVIQWGCENYSNRSDRDARDLCRLGFIRRATEEEKNRMFSKPMHEEVWLYIDKITKVIYGLD